MTSSSVFVPVLKPLPEGPKIKKFEISIEIENFDREWNFRASHPPRPYFLWGNRDIEIQIFELDQKFRSRLKISIEINFFCWSLGPLGLLAADNNQGTLRRTYIIAWRPAINFKFPSFCKNSKEKTFQRTPKAGAKRTFPPGGCISYCRFLPPRGPILKKLSVEGVT